MNVTHPFCCFFNVIAMIILVMFILIIWGDHYENWSPVTNLFTKLICKLGALFDKHSSVPPFFEK